MYCISRRTLIELICGLVFTRAASVLSLLMGWQLLAAINKPAAFTELQHWEGDGHDQASISCMFRTIAKDCGCVCVSGDLHPRRVRVQEERRGKRTWGGSEGVCAYSKYTTSTSWRWRNNSCSQMMRCQSRCPWFSLKHCRFYRIGHWGRWGEAEAREVLFLSLSFFSSVHLNYLHLCESSLFFFV